MYWHILLDNYQLLVYISIYVIIFGSSIVLLFLLPYIWFSFFSFFEISVIYQVVELLGYCFANNQA